MLENYIRNVGMDVPDNKKIEEIALSEKISKDRLKMLLNYLVRQNKLVFYQGNYIHTSIIEKTRKTLQLVLLDKEKGMNEKEVRLLLNSTKKFVKHIIAILIEEEVIHQQTFYIFLTEKGKL